MIELPLVEEEEIRPKNGILEEAHIPVRENKRKRREVVLEELEQQTDDQLRDIQNVNGGYHRRYPNKERQPSSRLCDFCLQKWILIGNLKPMLKQCNRKDGKRPLHQKLSQ